MRGRADLVHQAEAKSRRYPCTWSSHTWITTLPGSWRTNASSSLRAKSSFTWSSCWKGQNTCTMFIHPLLLAVCLAKLQDTAVNSAEQNFPPWHEGSKSTYFQLGFATGCRFWSHVFIWPKSPTKTPSPTYETKTQLQVHKLYHYPLVLSIPTPAWSVLVWWWGWYVGYWMCMYLTVFH